MIDGNEIFMRFVKRLPFLNKKLQNLTTLKSIINSVMKRYISDQLEMEKELSGNI